MNSSKDSTTQFEKTYLNLRGKESRLLENAIVKLLPYINEGPHASEWKIRARSSKRFTQYLKSQAHIDNILEIGCGNGWFTNLISSHTKATVYGTDINQTELDQAIELFQNNKTIFAHFNLETDNWQYSLPNLIVFNASIQYFPHLDNILLKAFNLLHNGGQIHIIDSPFYHPKELQEARKRSSEYFKKMGTPEMEKFYFHHDTEELLKFNPSFLYHPPKFPFNKFVKDSPFPWISISKPNE